MNRIGFYEENGEVRTEMQRITQLENTEAIRVFTLRKKPVFLQISFHTPMTEEELLWIYHRLIEYNIIDMTKEQMLKNAEEDLKGNRSIGTWEFVCKDFAKAFECALEIGKFGEDWEERFSMQISDEPTEMMKQWLDKKERAAIHRIMLDLDEKIDQHKYVNVGRGVEKEYDCSRELFNKAVHKMNGNGYRVRYIHFTNDELTVKILTDDNLNWKIEAPLIKRDILKKRAEAREEHAL